MSPEEKAGQQLRPQQEFGVRAQRACARTCLSLAWTSLRVHSCDKQEDVRLMQASLGGEYRPPHRLRHVEAVTIR